MGELDEQERAKFANFLFFNAASCMPSGKPAIQLEDYVKVVTRKENLLFEDIVGIIDSDTADRGILERLFLDPAFAGFSKDAEMIGRHTENRKRTKRKTAANFSDSIDYSARTHAEQMDVVREQGELSIMVRESNLARSMYGHEIIQEKMPTLEAAMAEIRSINER